MTKRDLRNHSRVLIDHNGNIDVDDATIRGNLHVVGKITTSSGAAPVVVAQPQLQDPVKDRSKMFFRELTMDSDCAVPDNAIFQWIADSSNPVTEIVVPTAGLYQVNVRIYSLGGCPDSDGNGGCGISFWVNGRHMYSSATNSLADCTNSLSITRYFEQGDQLHVRSILTTQLLADHRQAYTFQVAQLF